jgi:hypothetical protein
MLSPFFLLFAIFLVDAYAYEFHSFGNNLGNLSLLPESSILLDRCVPFAIRTNSFSGHPLQSPIMKTITCLGVFSKKVDLLL